MDGFRHDHLADADRPAPAGRDDDTRSVDASLATGTDPVTGPESVPPLRSDLTQHGRLDAEQGEVSDARSAIFQELRSQFDGLLPPSVILDCVDHAVHDLLGSISAEALTEMAIPLATVRLEHRIRATDQSPGAVKDTMAPAPPFTVIRPPAPGYPPLAMTVTTTGTTS